MKLLCRLGWHKWMYDRHMTALGTLETDCVMICGGKPLKYRSCSRCKVFEVSWSGGEVYEPVTGGVVLKLREDWEDELLSRDKVRQLEKLKLQVMSQNPTGIMVPAPSNWPMIIDKASDVVVPVKKSVDVRSIDDD